MDKINYHYCNYCKYFKAPSYIKLHNYIGICDCSRFKHRKLVQRVSITVTCWRPSCNEYIPRLKPVYGFNSPNELEEVKNNVGNKTDIKSEWAGMKLY